MSAGTAAPCMQCCTGKPSLANLRALSQHDVVAPAQSCPVRLTVQCQAAVTL